MLFLFVGDVNTHNGEWLGSFTITARQAARDCILSCEPMVMGSTHIGVLDLALTGVSDLVGFWVGSPVGTYS